MNPAPSSFSRLQTLQTAAALLHGGRASQACAMLRELVGQAPDFADAHRILGLALRALGEAAGAEASLRAALALAPRSGPTTYALGELLLNLGRAEEALAVVAPLAGQPTADLHLLTVQGESLKALGQLEEARGAFDRAVRATPQSAVAEHNLASVLGDLERFAESEAAVRRAFAKGLHAPESWLVLARSLVGQGRNAEAEQAYRQAIARRPDHVEAQAELAQLVWMQTEDASAATRALDDAIAAFPGLQALRLKRAELLQACGDPEGAYAAVADTVARPDAEPMMHVIAARFSMSRDPRRALAHAHQGARLLADNPVAQSTLIEAHFAAGEAAAALPIAERLHAAAPTDQHALAMLATAWRLLGDARYAALYDYASFVRTWRIDTPEGWSDLDSFVADLATSLEALHTHRTHPVGQSVRHGSQTSQRLTLSTDPVIRAFFGAVDGPIRRHIQALGAGGDPLRSRITGDYRFNGEWSVRLEGSGHHADHVHPRGWLSSAFYVSLPSAVERGREGWLKFGEPGVPTAPALGPEHFVKPEPGLLALFPSYMWHGTIPFGGAEARLTIAFDVIPA
ncbi:MAG: putative 2OG-Fe(II) oxygenase [Caulobacteraceae bacterium]